MIKKVLIVLAILAATVFAAGKWFFSLLPDKSYYQSMKHSQVADIPYLNQERPAHRGKILAVVTSVDTMGRSGKSTGYEFAELARAYWVFTANGFDVDIASPLGGEPPAVIDADDMGAFDYAFLNDTTIQKKLKNTVRIDSVEALDYEAVYFVGGKGTMFDFPEHGAIKDLVKALYQSGRVIAAVCHGPAALLNVQLDNGDWLLADKQVSSFTNSEELLLIPDAETIFPFLLENKLIEQGAKFIAGIDYLEQVVRDGQIVSGQNPWSVWSVAEVTVEALGYQPVPRVRTAEEHSVDLLKVYEQQGYDAALKELNSQTEAYEQVLILMHGILAFMKLEVFKGIDLLRIAHEIKSSQS
ncbi:type 1 glutamine amidotransferase domain-containing protein [Pseudoteredinibacter isoporae]|uniref:type 1 glutamine amidotransferase domain-containing protein n=1 Tax=Pseudoteredinibacter isoporae TaxID=570281 RepID=UPI0031059998